MNGPTDKPERSARRPLNRREFVSLGAGAFTLLALGVTHRRRARAVRRTVPVMGTMAEFVVVHDDVRLAHAAIDDAIRELQSVDRSMSHFRRDSDIGRVNLSGGAKAVTVCAATATVLRESIRWAELSAGRFDPCLGRATALWHVGDRRLPPSPAEVQRFAGERAYRELELDLGASEPRVLLRSTELAIDLGGIAKGYGVDRAVDALRGSGITDALVSAGGDLYALGRSENGDAWRIGVRDPYDPSAFATTLAVTDRAVATSGDYFQYFDYGGRRYHHLLDPATGEPRRSRIHSVTVAAATCMDADAAATTVFGCEPAPAQALLDKARSGAELVHWA